MSQNFKNAAARRQARELNKSFRNIKTSRNSALNYDFDAEQFDEIEEVEPMYRTTDRINDWD